MNFRKTLKLQGIRLSIGRYEKKEENPLQLSVKIEKGDENWENVKVFSKEMKEFIEIAEEQGLLIADSARKSLGFKPFKIKDVVQPNAQIAYFKLSKDEERMKLFWGQDEISFDEAFKFVGDVNIFVNVFESPKKGLLFIKTVCAMRITAEAPFDGEIAEDLEGAEGF